MPPDTGPDGLSPDCLSSPQAACSRSATTADARAAPAGAERHGLIGMRERVAAVGGELTVGPGGRGWVVRVRLPVHYAASGSAVEIP